MANEGWQNQEREQNGQFGPSLVAASPPPDTAPKGFGRTSIDTEPNIRDLATVIETEAKDQPQAAKSAVGGVVLNRMRRNHTSTVRDVWDGFVHVDPPKQESPAIAKALLRHPENDPSNGAIHFYAPRRMPKQRNHPGGRGQTLESIPGVEDKYHKPVRNYRPHYADIFLEVSVPMVDRSRYKFHRDPGNGPTR